MSSSQRRSSGEFGVFDQDLIPHRSTRQYVHQLQKWGIEKYNTRGKGSKKQKSKKDPDGNSQEGVPKAQVPADDNVSGLTPTYGGYGAGPTGQVKSLPVLSQPYRIQHSQGIQHNQGIQYNQAFMAPIHVQRRLANILYASGDSSAFAIYMRCCGAESSLHDLIACNRAAQTPNQAAEVRRELERYINHKLEILDSNTWVSVLIDFMSARTFDHGSDRRNATGQLESAVLFLLDNKPNPYDAPLRWLAPRESKLDLPLYLYLWYALRRWNDRCDRLIEPRKRVDIDRQLEQFVSQQIDGHSTPGSGSVEKIACLLSCLHFCRDALRSIPPPMIPEQVRGIHEVYQVIAALWGYWLVVEASGGAGMLALSWTKDAHDELAIPPEELLITVACMITSEANTCPGVSVMERAREGAHRLSQLQQVTIFHLFLHQYQLNNEKRLVSPEVDVVRSAMIPNVNPFRKYIFESLHLAFEVMDPNLPIFPLVLTTPEDRESITRSPRRP